MQSPQPTRMNLDDHSQPAFGSESRVARLRRCTTAAFALLTCALLVLAAGCRRPPSMTQDDKAVSGGKVDPWDAAVKRIRKESEVSGCRATLSALNNDLRGRTDVPQPASLKTEAEAQLAEVVPLSENDRGELRGAAFTSSDAVYLADCLYLRDVAKGLTVADLPPEQTADLAFAWVCRQVYLNSWILDVDQGRKQVIVMPPTSVLRRGHGSGLERMYVFLALLQQLGLDGCLIGPPEAEKQPAQFVVLSPDRRSFLTGDGRGPFWAVGVRTGNDVRLYDPWRGQPFPCTFKQLKAKPEDYKAWIDASENVSGLTVDEARKATAFLTVPVSSLTPRLALLEDRLKHDNNSVRLVIDPVKLQAAFGDIKPLFWSLAGDRFAYSRCGYTLLPPERGGNDPTAGYLFASFLRSQLPSKEEVMPRELAAYKDTIEDVGDRVEQIARSTYFTYFVDPPPTPRERLQRGQYLDAARVLVTYQQAFNRGLERLRGNPDSDQQIKQWAEQAIQIYDSLGRALTKRDPDEENTARKAIEEHWRTPAATLLLDRSVSEVGQAEATYLLALCKHEQAERAQARLERASPGEAVRLKQEATAAWAAARGEWRTYEAGYAKVQAKIPGRSAHTRALRERAELFAAKK